MKKMIMMAVMLMPFLFSNAFANGNTIAVKVNGLVCDFCARALEKMFSKQEAVLGIQVDLDQALVRVDVKEGQSIDDQTLKQLITDSGYNVVEIQRGE